MAGSTPIYGFPYPQPSDLVANYPAIGQELAEDVEGVISGLGSGLNLISPTSIANSGGTATSTGGVTTFTTVNSVSLNGVFTSTYRNYRIILRGAGSTGLSVNLRYRAAGSDASGSEYRFSTFFWTAAGATGNYANGNTATSAQVAAGVGTAPFASSFDVYNPQATILTTHSGHGMYDINGYTLYSHYNVTTSFDGFTLLASTGTITGTVYVYGYRGA